MKKPSTVSPSRKSVTRAMDTVPALEYSDASSSGGEERDDEQVDKSIAKGGVTTPFPWKLHDMLDAMDREGDLSIVCWQPHGRAFMVHKPKEFVDQIMLHYFNQTKYASFQRQLNLYGFARLSHGVDKNSYYHPCFVRGERDLCRGMIRLKVKGTKVRRSLTPEEEPNFYDEQWNRLKTSRASSPTAGPNAISAPSTIKVPKKISSSVTVPPIKSTAVPAPYKGVKVSQHPHASNQSNTASLYSLVLDSNRVAQAGAKAVMPLPPSLIKSSRPDHPLSAHANVKAHLPTSMPLDSAKGGDVLFFEGRPFCYLEHLEEIPPLPQQPTKQTQLQQQQEQSYKDSLTNIISSIVSSEPHQFIDTRNFCSV
jgi:HSF-type DNA-binding